MIAKRSELEYIRKEVIASTYFDRLEVAKRRLEEFKEKNSRITTSTHYQEILVLIKEKEEQLKEEKRLNFFKKYASAKKFYRANEKRYEYLIRALKEVTALDDLSVVTGNIEKLVDVVWSNGVPEIPSYVYLSEETGYDELRKGIEDLRKKCESLRQVARTKRTRLQYDSSKQRYLLRIGTLFPYIISQIPYTSRFQSTNTELIRKLLDEYEEFYDSIEKFLKTQEDVTNVRLFPLGCHNVFFTHLRSFSGTGTVLIPKGNPWVQFRFTLRITGKDLDKMHFFQGGTIPDKYNVIWDGFLLAIFINDHYGDKQYLYNATDWERIVQLKLLEIFEQFSEFSDVRWKSFGIPPKSTSIILSTDKTSWDDPYVLPLYQNRSVEDQIAQKLTFNVKNLHWLNFQECELKTWKDIVYKNYKEILDFNKHYGDKTKKEKQHILSVIYDLNEADSEYSENRERYNDKLENTIDDIGIVADKIGQIALKSLRRKSFPEIKIQRGLVRNLEARIENDIKENQNLNGINPTDEDLKKYTEKALEIYEEIGNEDNKCHENSPINHSPSDRYAVDVDLIQKYIDEKTETSFLDFKECISTSEKVSKCEFIKDMISFANTSWVENITTYMVIGVTDDFKIIGVENCDKKPRELNGNAHYHQLVKWYMEPPVDFSGRLITIENKELFVFVIRGDLSETPHVSNGKGIYDRKTKKYILEPNSGWIRNGPSKCKLSAAEIMKLKKKAFK
ncbi:MAG: helix-turn-helix domain-containing protein [Candidatus Odinarchaeota archaeon]